MGHAPKIFGNTSNEHPAQKFRLMKSVSSLSPSSSSSRYAFFFLLGIRFSTSTFALAFHTFFLCCDLTCDVPRGEGVWPGWMTQQQRHHTTRITTRASHAPCTMHHTPEITVSTPLPYLVSDRGFSKRHEPQNFFVQPKVEFHIDLNKLW